MLTSFVADGSMVKGDHTGRLKCVANFPILNPERYAIPIYYLFSFLSPKYHLELFHFITSKQLSFVRSSHAVDVFSSKIKSLGVFSFTLVT